MQLFIRNTLTNRREAFVPRDPARPTMYVCGPTVYGPAHVGNARPAVVFDLVARILRNFWPAAAYARNITDIDDKIIAAAKTESVAELAARCAAEYRNEMSALRVLPPDFEPHATAHIPEMQAMIARLIEKGFAYEADGHALFHTASFSEYGALSNRSRDEMIAGARVEVAPYKRDPADFVLWKPSPDGMPGWESPWGRGRPGWHLECSAMAAKCLGEEIDIHGGGQDLIFPHHENEIAQSRCAHDAPRMARYWMHNGHVSADGEKMSKSLGNVFLIRDALSAFPGEAVRRALLSAHYRRPLSWSENLLRESHLALDRLYESLRASQKFSDSESESAAKDDGGSDSPPPVPDAVLLALCDDVNTPLAMSALHEIATALNRATASGDAETARARRLELLRGGRFMGFLQESPKQWLQGGTGGAGVQRAKGLGGTEGTDATGGTNGGDGTEGTDGEIDKLVAERDAARARKDFATADAIRKELSERGIEVSDSPTGATWRRSR